MSKISGAHNVPILKRQCQCNIPTLTQSGDAHVTRRAYLSKIMSVLTQVHSNLFRAWPPCRGTRDMLKPKLLGF